MPPTDSLTLAETYYQSFGLRLVSAPGAALARPDALTSVAIADGGPMGLPSLHTFALTAESTIVLVFNDACYGAEIHQYGSQGLDERIMKIDQIVLLPSPRDWAQGIAVKTMND